MCEVSVIVPIYDVEPYLRECLDSALAQTFADFELILVDDGSPDGCGRIIDEYAQRDARIRVVHQENRGLSGARNAGLDIANGTYVCFLDADDRMKPTLLEQSVAEMRTGVDMVVFDREIFPANYDYPALHHFHEPRMYETTDQRSRLNLICNTYITSVIIYEVWSRMFRRDLIELHRLRFYDNAKIYAEDIYFCSCYLAHASKVSVIPDTLYEYRQRSDSITGRTPTETLLPRMHLLGRAIREHLEASDDCEWLASEAHLIEYQLLQGHLWRSYVRQVVMDESFRETRERLRELDDDVDDLDRIVRATFATLRKDPSALYINGRLRRLALPVVLPCLTGKESVRLSVTCAALRVAQTVFRPAILKHAKRFGISYE